MTDKGWQPIETAPDQDFVVMAVPLIDGWFISVARFGEEGELENQDGDGIGYINYAATHWMPLPAPPQDQPGRD